MTENIDSLLDDLEHLVMPSPRGEGANDFKHVPHPPQVDKSLNNPKNKFVVPPISDYSQQQQHSSNTQYKYGSETDSSASIAPKSYSSASISKPKQSEDDGNVDVDSLLAMMQSPGREKHKINSPQQYTEGGASSSSLPSAFQPSNTGESPGNTSFSWGSPRAQSSPPVPISSQQPHASVLHTPPHGTIDSEWDSPNSSASGNASHVPPLLTTPPTHTSKAATPSPPKNHSQFHIPSSTSGFGASDNSLISPGGHAGSSNSSSQVSLFSHGTPSASSGGGSSGYTSSGVTAAQVRTLHATSNSSSGTKTRCNRVVIGGSGLTRGAKTSAFSKSGCDRLRCLQCNFEVLQFADVAWDESAVDYMFFRNNVPNTEKLSVHFKSSPGSCAYCCQCTWRSMSADETLTTGSPTQPHWTCTGH